MRHDPLRLAPPRRREVEVLRIPIRRIFVPITHDLVRAATVDEARQATHQLDEVTEGGGRRRPELADLRQTSPDLVLHGGVLIGRADQARPKLSIAFAISDGSAFLAILTKRSRGRRAGRICAAVSGTGVIMVAARYGIHLRRSGRAAHRLARTGECHPLAGLASVQPQPTRRSNRPTGRSGNRWPSLDTFTSRSCENWAR